MRMNNYKNEENLQNSKKIQKSEDLRESIINEYNPLEDLNVEIINLNETEDLDAPIYKKKDLLVE